MKLVTLAVCACITSAFLINCSSPAEKVEDAKQEVTEAHNDLDEANEAYLADIETFREEKAAEIALNEQQIAQLKATAAYAKKDAKPDYKKKIDELEAENNELKKALEEYEGDGKSKWEIFKAEFSHDMKALGEAFKNTVTKNIEVNN
ncbi:MAG: hypothetical protein ACHQF2_09875 [Flavobacteriales bacterium]